MKTSYVGLKTLSNFCLCDFLICLLILGLPVTNAFREQGKFDVILNKDIDHVDVPKSLYNGSQIFIQILCDSEPPGTNVTIQWKLLQLKCWEDSLYFGEELLEQTDYLGTKSNRTMGYVESGRNVYTCGLHTHIILDEWEHLRVSDGNNQDYSKNMAGRSIGDDAAKQLTRPGQMASSSPVYTTQVDGVYLLRVQIGGSMAPFNASVHIEMQKNNEFLSAVDYPLLHFFGAMCLVYVGLGIAWLLVSFCQWRDLLRIQFWIGGVILLGMLEKATFYAEYQNINSTGQSMQGAVLFAELVSCAKRMLARMLVIVVSLGFGIVKPRLGPMLHRVVGTGSLYFLLAAIESYLRVKHRKNDPSNQILVASIPLAVLDSAICWWIFTSLVQTIRTLRLRRNVVKLSLYRHFSNTLIFSVVASVVFMLYSIKYHRLAVCLTDWKDLWIDEAYWHLLFSVLLLVIMILWRPTNNNQRYAFTPLLDAPEDGDDDEEEQFSNDAFGVKMRGMNVNSSPKPKSSNSEVDDLKWVEDNIPSSMAVSALPILDSDEEIMTTKFEVSKMQ